MGKSCVLSSYGVQYAFPWGNQDVESISNEGKSGKASDNLSLIPMGAGLNRGEFYF